MQRPSAPPARALLVGLFLVSLALIVLEVTLTRVFSVMIWNHLSFVAITLALLGFSLAGLVFFFFPELLHLPTPALLLVGTAGFALGLFGVGEYILETPLIADLLAQRYGPAGRLAAAGHYLAGLFGRLVVPFFFSGVVISAAIVKEARRVGAVYAANLLGSGAACLAVIAALNSLGAFRTLLLVFLLVVAAFLAFLFLVRRRWVRVLAGVPALGLCGYTAWQLLHLPAAMRFIHPVPLIAKRTDAGPENTLLRKWNSFSCVDFYRIREVSEGFWGLNRQLYRGPIPPNLGVLIDAWALTTIVNVTDDITAHPVFDYVPSAVAYRLRPAPPRDVLILGAGGGIDVLIARHFRAHHIVAVELNPLIVAGARRRYPELRDLAAKDPRHFSGWTNRSVYDLPGVEVHVAEGRHFVDRTDRTFDMVLLPGVDTATGTEAGSFSFSENYLYTVEAMEAYLRRLRPGGLLYLLRFSVTRRPSEMLRLAAIAAAALEREGVAEPWRQLLVYHSGVHVFACLLVKKGAPFTPAELRRARAEMNRLRFRLLFSPDGDGANQTDFAAYLRRRGPEREAFLASYPYRVHPVTDDAPFFFNFTRFADIFHPFAAARRGKIHLLYYVGQTVLYYCLFAVVALALLFLLLPLLRFRLRRTPLHWGFVVYFLLLGLAYILVEIILMQKFVFYLGKPVYALAVVLFSLLTFSGLGSWVSGRVERPATERLLFFLLVAAQVALLVGYGGVTRATFPLPVAVRVAVGVGLLAPLGFLMGMPFPLGVRLAARRAPALLSWVWSLNGYASVLGSVLSVVLAIQIGFTPVLLGAVGLYAAAALLYLRLARRDGGGGLG